MKLGIIHTTPATIQSLKNLVNEIIPGCEVINILDDSILPIMNSGDSEKIASVGERWIGYASNLEKLGCDVVLSACSTVGGFAEKADEILSVTVKRIDEAMCERATEMGENVSVFATLRSTLDPTVDYIRRKAGDKKININTVLVEGAYDKLMAGDKSTHDALIKASVEKYLDSSDAIVLAQASMASAAPESDKILTSPKMGIERIRDILTK